MKAVFYGKTGKWVRRGALFLLDLFFVYISIELAILMRYEGMVGRAMHARIMNRGPWLMLIYTGCSMLGGVYEMTRRNSDSREILRLAIAYIASAAISIALSMGLKWQISRAVLGMTAVFMLLLALASRFIRKQIRKLNVPDILSRAEVILDMDMIRGYLTDKVVLVTGGGGSIGSEICRQIMRFKPAKLLILDIYENCAYELECELRQKYGNDCPIEVLIGSIRDKRRMDDIFKEYHPTVVFHAAAHKHVPLMEVSPGEAVKNNIFGTRNLLQSASEHGVERFVQLSTDKAVNPTNVMGATKRVAEMLIQSYARATDMKCMAVRFGNVLGSHGSVIPLFESQIRNGGPVTLTHPDITRYFMTIPEAAQLVLQAGGLASSGAIYVLDMGEPVKIMDLARKLIRFYGYEPGVDMEIKITGLRPGEKLHEELLMDKESQNMVRTAHDKIFVAPPIELNADKFEANLAKLWEAAHSGSSQQVVDALTETVQTYIPNRSGLRPEATAAAQTASEAIAAAQITPKF